MANILLIDQSIFTAKHLSAVIASAAGLEVTLATTTGDALHLAAQLQPACILLDASLPGPDLPSLCQKFQSFGIPLLVIYTPIAPYLQRIAVLQNTPNKLLTFLERPFSGPALLGKLQALISQPPESQAPRSLGSSDSLSSLGSLESLGTPQTMDNTYQWLKTTPDLLGYSVLSSEGYLVETEGVATPEHCGVINYLLDLAKGFGDDLGLEQLEELQIFGKTNRILSSRLPHATVNVVTGPKADLRTIAQKLRETLS